MCGTFVKLQQRVATLLVLLLASSSLSWAYPRHFINDTRGFVSNELKCIAHPTTGVQQHPSVAVDSGMSFKFSTANGAVADVLCPGTAHSLMVSFANIRRQGLLNTNPPLVNFTSPSPWLPECPNQVIASGQGSFSTTFTVPCRAAGSNIMFKVTASGGSDSYIWKQNSMTMPVADASSPELAAGGVCEASVAACGLTVQSPRTCKLSTLGYQCMAEWRNVTVHWSVNSTSAPSNLCTPTRKTTLSEADISQIGSLHIAVQSSATGYVSLGFAAKAGMMIPSDIIMGWAGSESAAVVSTFDASASGYLAQNDISANSWAYDTGAVADAAGVTTLCFSRRLADTRAKSVPDLRARGTVLDLNYAVSEEDALVVHKRGSVGGFQLDLVKGIIALSPPPAASPPPITSPPPPVDGDLSGAPTGAKTCTPSTLGYQCMVQQGKVTLHWSLNTNSAPTNPCTPASKTLLQDSEVAQKGTLHAAVQSATQGYVGLGFTSDPTQMYDSDIVVGWLEGSGSGWINAFHVTGYSIGDRDMVSTSWAYDKGVTRDAAGVTTICFSRRLLDERAKASPDLRAATGSSSGSTTSGTGGRRSLAQASEGSPKLPLIWAISSQAALVWHTGDNRGGFYLDVTSGVVGDAPSTDRQYWINVHGALMAVAWGLLLPLGTLLPAHRWLLGDLKVAGKHVWFWAHMICQWSGMALFIAGFVVAFTHLDMEGNLELAEAHENIGIAIMAAAGAQVVLGYLRPSPDHPRRGVWNLLHHNLGRATVFLAWANVYIGIVVYHTNWAISYAPWIAPIATVMGLLVIIDVVLRLVGRGRSDPAAPAATMNAYVVSEPDNNGIKAAVDGKGTST